MAKEVCGSALAEACIPHLMLFMLKQLTFVAWNNFTSFNMHNTNKRAEQFKALP